MIPVNPQVVIDELITQRDLLGGRAIALAVELASANARIAELEAEVKSLIKPKTQHFDDLTP